MVSNGRGPLDSGFMKLAISKEKMNYSCFLHEDANSWNEKKMDLIVDEGDRNN